MPFTFSRFLALARIALPRNGAECTKMNSSSMISIRCRTMRSPRAMGRIQVIRKTAAKAAFGSATRLAER